MLITAYHSRPEAEDWVRTKAEAFKTNPNVSTRLKDLGLGEEDARGYRLAATGRVLVVYVGQCGSCSASALNLKDASFEGYDQVWLLYAAEGGDGHPRDLELPDKARIVVAPEAKLRRSLSPLWVGKVMLFKDGEPVPTALAGSMSGR
ncbi:MAG: hypothetical protein KF884_05630 [Fimbriimonadaceae bacterium]|nr:MAG: hypothetical protein KF884_05630 [Fimbriimonadaceae bacterium]